MRILSQDGMIDVPYEKVIVQISGNGDNSIIAYTNSEGEGYLTMAEYSTEAKAKRAMEMLREFYKLHVAYKAMLTREKELFLKVQSEEERENTCGMFQFPADNELED